MIIDVTNPIFKYVQYENKKTKSATGDNIIAWDTEKKTGVRAKRQAGALFSVQRFHHANGGKTERIELESFSHPDVQPIIKIPSSKYAELKAFIWEAEKSGIRIEYTKEIVNDIKTRNEPN